SMGSAAGPEDRRRSLREFVDKADRSRGRPRRRQRPLPPLQRGARNGGRPARIGAAIDRRLRVLALKEPEIDRGEAVDRGLDRARLKAQALRAHFQETPQIDLALPDPVADLAGA